MEVRFQWCTAKLTCYEKTNNKIQNWFVAFANCRGVNAPMVDFKLQPTYKITIILVISPYELVQSGSSTLSKFLIIEV